MVATHDFDSLLIVHAMARPTQVPEVMTMPKSLQWVLDHQDELAKRFEEFEPRPEDGRDPDAFRRLLSAASRRADVESEVADAVAAAREAGYSWAMIGGAIGTTGQAAQQRYGKLPKTLGQA